MKKLQRSYGTDKVVRCVWQQWCKVLTELLRQVLIRRPSKLGLGRKSLSEGGISPEVTFSIGSAYGEGLKVAKGAFVILMDADLSHHVSSKTIPCHLFSLVM